jgi:hypothetical protein
MQLPDYYFYFILFAIFVIGLIIGRITMAIEYAFFKNKKQEKTKN